MAKTTLTVTTLGLMTFSLLVCGALELIDAETVPWSWSRILGVYTLVITGYILGGMAMWYSLTSYRPNGDGRSCDGSGSQ